METVTKWTRLPSEVYEHAHVQDSITLQDRSCQIQIGVNLQEYQEKRTGSLDHQRRCGAIASQSGELFLIAYSTTTWPHMSTVG